MIKIIIKMRNFSCGKLKGLIKMPQFLFFFLSIWLSIEYSLDKSFVSWLGLQFTSVVITGVAVGAGGSGAKSI